MRRTLSALLIPAALALPSMAQAGELTDLAAQVESLLAAGDDTGAIAAARDLIDKTWASTNGLSFRSTELVQEPVPFYGAYNPRTNNAIKINEPIYIYAEPEGYGFGSPGEGLYSIGFFVDLKVVNASGETVGEVPNITELDLTSRHSYHEFHGNLTYTLNGIPPGSYVLQTTLRDKNSARIGSFDTLIELVE